MIDRKQFSRELLKLPVAKNDAALQRIAVAKARILSVLDREIVSHQKTLEQKISEQGPVDQRVDPHLIGLAIYDMLALNRLKKLQHDETNTKSWYTNVGTKDAPSTVRLNELAPLYASVSGGGFGNLTGDALEVVTFQCIAKMNAANSRYQYLGHFHMDQPKQNGRFKKIQPPKAIGGGITVKEADFILFGFDPGPLCIECKNFREWLYPSDHKIKELIIKAYELRSIPIMIDRRIHYTTLTNFLEPAGIIAHESYYQYYPSDQAELAEKVKHKRSLGFTDVMPTETPHARTIAFFEKSLPKIVEPMGKLWNAKKEILYEYANGALNLSQMYKAIGSRAGTAWVDGEDEPDESFYE